MTQVLGQGLSLDIIHYHVGERVARLRGIDGLEVIDLYDIGMVQGSNRSCFTDEAGYEFRVIL